MSNEEKVVAVATENKSAVVDANNARTGSRKSFNRNNRHDDGVKVTAANYPEHIVNMVLLLKNNAEIRRFTSLGILNYLLQKGEINGDKRYVSFKWDKFTVKYNGLMREYRYTEMFFLVCLVASFTSFANSAGATINEFTRKELHKSLNEILTNEDIDKTAEDVDALKEEVADSEVAAE